MRICLQRREFIAALGGVVALPLAARAQQPAGMRRIGVLMAGDENDPVQKPQVLLSRRRLRAWAGLMAATCGWTFVGPATTSIGCERSRWNWSACNPTSSLQAGANPPLPSGGRRGRSQSSLRARATPSPSASSSGSTARVGTSPASPTWKPRWEASGLSCSPRLRRGSSEPQSCSILTPLPHRLYAHI